MKIKLFLFALICLATVACDHINDDDRLIYVEPAQQDSIADSTATSTQRRVLLEDFTGQMCVNCPRGTEVIEQMQEAYGDRLVAVGIHGGPLGFKGNATATGLATDLGDEYYNHWQLEYQPVGLVNRHGAVNYPDWMTQVREELAQPSVISMALEATINGDQITINVKETCLNGHYDGTLQVWVLEDSITATQKRHEPIDNDNVTINDKNYVHNHVLRTAVNGNWGEAITLTTNEPKTQTYQQTVDEKWNKAHLSVVAFVYNSNGVEQTVKTKITQ